MCSGIGHAQETLFGEYGTQRSREKNETGETVLPFISPDKGREDDCFSTSSHSAADTCLTHLHAHSTPPLTVHRTQNVWSHMLDDACRHFHLRQERRVQ